MNNFHYLNLLLNIHSNKKIIILSLPRLSSKQGVYLD